MNNRLAHVGQDRFGAFETLVAAADHESERTAIGRSDTTGYRGVDRNQALCFRHGRHIAGAVDIDGRAIDYQSAGIGVDDDFIFIDLADMSAGRQHGDHSLHVLDRLSGIAYRMATRLASPRQCFAGQVKGINLMACFCEIGGHPAAHIAKANKSDFHFSLQ